MSIKDLIKKNENNALELMVEQIFNGFFVKEQKKKKERFGLHASSLIKSDNHFCYREQVLSLLYKQNDGSLFSIRTLRIFKNGDYVHYKWQNFFREYLQDSIIEGASYSKKYDFHYTPDAIISLFNRRFVVEIKSQNTYQYKATKDHRDARIQLQIYLHFKGIPEGLILVEDKNTQEIKIIYVQYDYELVRKYLKRLNKTHDYKDIFLNEKKLVSRKCKDCNLKRVANCNMRDACFNIGNGRIRLEKKDNDENNDWD